jgi:hypothetical protein
MGQDGYTLIVGRHLIGMRPTYESNVAMDSLDFDGGLFCWKNYSDRYTGPFRPISRVQDLPLGGNSGRHKIPVAWSNETANVEVATPNGMRRTNIACPSTIPSV